MNQYIRNLTGRTADQLSHYYAACQIELDNIRKKMKNPPVDSFSRSRIDWRKMVMTVSLNKIKEAVQAKDLSDFGIHLQDFQPPIKISQP